MAVKRLDGTKEVINDAGEFYDATQNKLVDVTGRVHAVENIVSDKTVEGNDGNFSRDLFFGRNLNGAFSSNATHISIPLAILATAMKAAANTTHPPANTVSGELYVGPDNLVRRVP